MHLEFEVLKYQWMTLIYFQSQSLHIVKKELQGSCGLLVKSVICTFMSEIGETMVCILLIFKNCNTLHIGNTWTEPQEDTVLIDYALPREDTTGLFGSV